MKNEMVLYATMFFMYGFTILSNVFVYWVTSNGFRKNEWDYDNAATLCITLVFAFLYTVFIILVECLE